MSRKQGEKAESVELLSAPSGAGFSSWKLRVAGREFGCGFSLTDEVEPTTAEQMDTERAAGEHVLVLWPAASKLS